MRSLPLFALSFALSFAACTGDDAATGTDTVTTDPTAGSESDSDSDSDSGNETMLQLCGSGVEEPSTSTNLMEEWGAPCTKDDECIATLGAGAQCLDNILDIYLLPMGYCAKLCSLPDDSTLYVEDDPACSADGGVTCLGQRGFFEVCAVECTSDDECQRDGYTCQVLPALGSEGDPKYCLMAPNCTQACVDDPTQDGC